MSQSSQDPSWLPWLGALAPIGVTLWGFMKRFFSCVTRGELQQTIERLEQSHEEQRQQFHQENLENFRVLFDRLAKVEQSQARTEGMLSGRYPRMPS